jgi:hypothetical protein
MIQNEICNFKKKATKVNCIYSRGEEKISLFTAINTDGFLLIQFI